VLAADTKIPVMGASVIIRGTTNGTLTDLDGKFTLTGLKKDDVIQVSFVGFQTRSVIIKDESPLTIMLDDDVQNLDEMLVVGMNSNGDGTTAVKVQIKKKSGEKSYLEGKMTSTKKDGMTVNQVDWQKKSSYDEPQEKVIFQVVEEMPEFPGGMAEAMKFLGKNIKYPVAAQEAKIEGRVIVQFVVERDGCVSDVKVMRGVNPELDAEAIRVVSMMPNWIPGKQRGKAVAVKYTMPIMFRLQTSVPKAEDTAQGFQHISLKVDKDAAQADVDMVKDHLRNRNPYGEDGNTIVLRTRGASKGKSTDNVLVIVDGEIKGYGQSTLNTVPVDQVESLEIMKKETAIAQYGDKAKDGVISIVTKKNKK
jgi:TonB family protein